MAEVTVNADIPITAVPTPAVPGAEDNGTHAATNVMTSQSELPAAGNGEVRGEVAEDGYPQDLDIPVRYVKGMGGDMVEARRRWIASLEVRADSKCWGDFCSCSPLLYHYT